MKNLYFKSFLVAILPLAVLGQNPELNTTLVSNRQVSESLFDSLAFKDLNFLIVGDDSPKEGLSYEYAEDLSTLETSIYLSEVKFLGADFITADADFSADSRIYFFDDNGGKQATISLNIFGVVKYFRRFDKLFKTKDDNKELDTERSLANIRTSHMQAEYLIQLYSKYIALIEVLDQSGFEGLFESQQVEDDIEIMNNEFNRVFSNSNSIGNESALNIDDYKRSISLNDYKKNATTLDYNHNFIDENDASISEEISTSSNGYRTDLIIAELNKLQKEADSLAGKLNELEEVENQDVWNSKHIWYTGVSPYYGRESRDAYLQKPNTSNYKFETIRRDIYGVRFSTGYFIQSKSRWAKKIFGLISFEAGRSTNYDEISTSTVRIKNQIGDNENVESISEKKAYDGTQPYKYAFKTAGSAEVYWWPFKKLGAFTTIGFENHNFKLDQLDEKKIPFRFGLLWDFKRAEKKKKLAVLQIFANRPDLKAHPKNEKEGMQFGLKIGFPINVKDKL